MTKIIASLVLIIVLAGCEKQTDAATQPVSPEQKSRPAKLLVVSLGNSQFERTFPATTEAGDKVTLTFRVPGQMQTIDVVAGQSVAKGQVLATLNPDEYSLLENQAQAQFRLADVQYQRYQKLRVGKVVSEQDYEQFKAELNSAKATLDQAKANLRYTRLIAPYDGTISLVSVENYEYTSAKQAVMNIQTNQLLKVHLLLPGHLINRLSSGENLSASMVFDAFPGRHYELTFQKIDTEADPKTGSYQVTMIMERPQDTIILPGMAGTVNLKVDSGGATIIPLTALMVSDEKHFVWRVDHQGVVSKVEIKLNEQGQVISGLKDGDQIIISGVNSITPGIKVREWVKERGL